MSEYYARGRAVFADATSFIFFVLGFLAAGAFGWPALRLAFESGAYDRGLAVYVARLLGGGLAAGLFGYITGALTGRLWQALHQWRRARRRDVGGIGQGASGNDASVPGLTSAPAERTAEAPKRTPVPMSCRVGPLTPSNYAAFSRRLADGTAIDNRYSESSSTEILTLAAWDGLQIAGVARLLSDGYGALFITDFVVDPFYVASDVEDRLIAFAVERVPPGGRLTRV